MSFNRQRHTPINFPREQRVSRRRSESEDYMDYSSEEDIVCLGSPERKRCSVRRKESHSMDRSRSRSNPSASQNEQRGHSENNMNSGSMMNMNAGNMMNIPAVNMMSMNAGNIMNMNAAQLQMVQSTLNAQQQNMNNNMMQCGSNSFGGFPNNNGGGLNMSNQVLQINPGNQAFQINSNNQSLQINSGNQPFQINPGNQGFQINPGNQNFRINPNGQNFQINSGNRPLHINPGSQAVHINSGDRGITIFNQKSMPQSSQQGERSQTSSANRHGERSKRSIADRLGERVQTSGTNKQRERSQTANTSHQAERMQKSIANRKGDRNPTSATKTADPSRLQLLEELEKLNPTGAGSKFEVRPSYQSVVAARKRKAQEDAEGPAEEAYSKAYLKRKRRRMKAAQEEDPVVQTMKGFMTRPPRGISVAQVLEKINEKLSKELHYTGPSVELDCFQFSYYVLTFPSKQIRDLVIDRISPLEEKSMKPVHIMETRPPKNYETRPNWTVPTRTTEGADEETVEAPESADLDESASVKTAAVSKIASDGLDQKTPNKATLETKNSPSEKTPSLEGDKCSDSTPRDLGVFPSAVQPNRVVVVVDETVTYVDIKTLRRRGFEVLAGNDLDIAGFTELIIKDNSFKEDDTLYVVVPGFSFLLKRMNGYIFNAEESKINTDPKDKNSVTDLLNIVKDFSDTIEQADIEILTAQETSRKLTSSRDDCYSTRVMVQRLVHSALQLRSIVRNSSLNCDVVFCGFPAHLMSMEGVEEHFAGRETPTDVLPFSGSLLNSLSVFNTVAINTWKLGYPSQLPSFNPDADDTDFLEVLQTDKIIEEIKLDYDDDTIEPASVVEKVSQEDKKHDLSDTVDLVDVTVSSSSVHDGNLSKTETVKEQVEAMDDSLTVLEDEEISVVSQSDSNVNESSTDIANQESISKLADGESPNVEGVIKLVENKAKFVEDTKDSVASADTSDTNKIISESGEGERQEVAGFNLIFDEDEEIDLDYEADEDFNEEDKIKAEDPSKSTQELSNSKQKKEPEPVVEEEIEEEEVVFEEEDTKPTSGFAVPLMHLKEHDWFAATLASCGAATPADSTSTSNYVSRWFMGRLLQLLHVAKCHSVNKVSVLPWTPVCGEDDLKHGEVEHLSDLVRESCTAGILLSGDDGNGYHCDECEVDLGSPAEADDHCYTTKHLARIKNLRVRSYESECGSDDSDDAVSYELMEQLTGRERLANNRALQRKHFHQLVDAKIIDYIDSEDDVMLAEEDDDPASYRCLLCKVDLPSYRLRFHLASDNHRVALNVRLGLSKYTQILAQHDEWRTVKLRMMRHPAMDVVILSDEMNHVVLRDLAATHPRIQLFVYPDLMRNPSGRQAAIERWTKKLSRRPTLWLIVPGVDLLVASSEEQTRNQPARVDMIAEYMYNVHSYIRLNVPAEHAVLTTPVLPLHVLVDTLPQHIISNVINVSNSVTVAAEQVTNISRSYQIMFSRSIAIHDANAAHENIHPVPKSAINSGMIRILDSTSLPCQLSSVSLWHVAFQGLAMQALTGLPAPHLRHEKGVDAKSDLEITSRLNRAAIVGYVDMNMETMITKRKLSVYKKHLQFSSDDLAHILENCAKTEPKESPLTWCLTCPVPGFLMTMHLFEMCIEKKCQVILRSWKFKDSYDPREPESISVSLRTFLTKLQSQLPRGNYANVFPVCPTTLISYHACSEQELSSQHALLHRLQAQYCGRVLLSSEPREMLEPAMASVRRSWQNMYASTKLGHTYAFSEEELCPLTVVDASEAQEVLERNFDDEWEQWEDTTRSYCYDYSPLVDVSFPRSTRKPMGVYVPPNEDEPIVLD